MAGYKIVNVDPETYKTIVEFAKLQNRTIGGQVAYMVKLFTNTYRVVALSPLHHTDEEEIIPMVAPTEGG